MELADALDSKSCGSDTVSVRPRSAAPRRNGLRSIPIFLFKKNQSYASSFLLFRKKARSACLFACKRAPGRLTVATTFLRVCLRRKHSFCEYACGANISMVWLFRKPTDLKVCGFLFSLKLFKNAIWCLFGVYCKNFRINLSYQIQLFGLLKKSKMRAKKSSIRKNL